MKQRESLENDTAQENDSQEISRLIRQQRYGNQAAIEEMHAGHHHGHDHSGERNHRGGPRGNSASSKRGALRQHARNLKIINRIMESGRNIQTDPNSGPNSRVNLLHNTIEWIDNGNCDFYVLTPTHDSHLRPNVAPNQNAYFDQTKKFNEGGSNYQDQPNQDGTYPNDARIIVEDAGTLGWLDGTDMIVLNPTAFSESLVVETLIHEIQHDADQHNQNEPWRVQRPNQAPGTTHRAPTWVYNSYQTEFRAYWYENPEGSTADAFDSSTDQNVNNTALTVRYLGNDNAPGGGDDTTKTVNTAFTNKRQQSIFNHLLEVQADNIYYDADGFRGAYGFVTHFYALDPAFKRMVDSYAFPQSGNVINSIRIQTLSTAMDTGGDWVAAANALDSMDCNYLNDRNASQPFWTQANNDLNVQELQQLQQIISGGIIVGPHISTIEVVAGDTLSTISDRYLNDRSRWREIYRINRAVIGDNPNSIRPGMTLHLP